MDKLTLEKTILEETKQLSSEMLNEVLDFIHFIRFKKESYKTVKPFDGTVNDSLDELNKLSLSHLEEEFENYKELYPYEG